MGGGGGEGDNLCTLYLLACQVTVTAGDWGLCRVHVTSFER